VSCSEGAGGAGGNESSSEPSSDLPTKVVCHEAWQFLMSEGAHFRRSARPAACAA
jgi:hypothetical protein